MCGIVAILGQQTKKESENFKFMLSSIQHRGDSLFETKDYNNCLLGVNRLKILDRENARQPFTDTKESLGVIYNGEIYNYKELRNELKNLGYKFKTDADTEVLLCGYKQWKEKLLPKFDGMFAFIIFDRQKNKIFAARDQFGIKPLYYLNDGKFFYFSSEIKSFVFLGDKINKLKQINPGHYFDSSVNQQYKYFTRSKKALFRSCQNFQIYLFA